VWLTVRRRIVLIVGLSLYDHATNTLFCNGREQFTADQFRR
jgi:hypothetical protein